MNDNKSMTMARLSLIGHTFIALSVDGWPAQVFLSFPQQILNHAFPHGTVHLTMRTSCSFSDAL